jgi:hypothetical protein
MGRAWLAVGIKTCWASMARMVPREKLVVGPEAFGPEDLTSAPELGRRCDLVMSFEVSEHLPAAGRAPSSTTSVDTRLWWPSPQLSPGQRRASHHRAALRLLAGPLRRERVALLRFHPSTHHRVYSFAALTFVLVYVARVMVLGERIALRGAFGVVLVLCGLV